MKIIIIITAIDRNIRFLFLFFLEQCFFFRFVFVLICQKTFKIISIMQKQQKLISNVIHRIIDRMLVGFFFVSILDFVNLKNVFLISNLFFEIIRFIQNFEQIIFVFVLVFNLILSLKFEISLSIFNAIDVYR